MSNSHREFEYSSFNYKIYIIIILKKKNNKQPKNGMNLGPPSIKIIRSNFFQHTECAKRKNKHLLFTKN